MAPLPQYQNYRSIEPFTHARGPAKYKTQANTRANTRTNSKATISNSKYSMYNQPKAIRGTFAQPKPSIDFYNELKQTTSKVLQGQFQRKRRKNKNPKQYPMPNIIIKNPVIVNINTNCLQTFHRHHNPLGGRTEQNTTHNSLENLFLPVENEVDIEKPNYFQLERS